MGLIRDAANGLLAGLTAPQFANDKDFATTEFVQRALGNYRAYYWYDANTTLSASHVGCFIGIGDANIILPPTASVAPGASVNFLVTGSAGGTLSVSGGGNLIVGGSGVYGASWQFKYGDEFTCTSDGTVWIVRGIATLKQNAAFGASLAANGYQKLPSGLIIQWGVIGVLANSNATTSLPIAFPNTALHGYANYDLPTSNAIPASAVSFVGNTQIKVGIVGNGSGTHNLHYLAVGY